MADNVRHAAASSALTALSPVLKRWDRRAARRADVYLACSSVARRAIENVYGLEAEVLPPPPALVPDGHEAPVAGVQPGFLLCVARLLPYKNVDVVIRGAQRLGGPDLVIVGDGPDEGRLREIADRDPRTRVHFLGRVRDDELRWIYRNASVLVGASYEDFGLSPLEAGAFGRPSVVLRDGGYLDTVREGRTGTFFDSFDADEVASAIGAAIGRTWDPRVITDHVATFGVDRFVARLRQVVAEQQAVARS